MARSALTDPIFSAIAVSMPYSAPSYTLAHMMPTAGDRKIESLCSSSRSTASASA